MNSFDRWKTEKLKRLDSSGTRFNCPRCNTKNTSADEILQLQSTINEFEKVEIFTIYICATCHGISIHYGSSEFEKVYMDNENLPPGIPPKYDLKSKNSKSSIFPITNFNSDVPDKVSSDYSLMHLCFLIGSSQGVAVHYRRVLDKIFSEYEGKFLTGNEREIKKIDERAKKISEKNVYFKGFNETIKDLKGIVSTIVHTDLNDLELSSDLIITQEDFDQLDRIILSLIKVYELEFKDLPSIKDKSKRISELKKDK